MADTKCLLLLFSVALLGLSSAQSTDEEDEPSSEESIHLPASSDLESDDQDSYEKKDNKPFIKHQGGYQKLGRLGPFGYDPWGGSVPGSPPGFYQGGFPGVPRDFPGSWQGGFPGVLQGGRLGGWQGGFPGGPQGGRLGGLQGSFPGGQLGGFPDVGQEGHPSGWQGGLPGVWKRSQQVGWQRLHQDGLKSHHLDEQQGSDPVPISQSV